MSRFRFDSARPIGDGGFGEVFRAYRVNDQDEITEDRLAFKRLKLAWCSNPDVVARFQREVRLQQDTLDHPNVMPVIARNVSADQPWFVMPLAERSMRDDLDNPFGLSPDFALNLFGKIVSAIAHAHDRDVLHRDLKPENVLFVNDVPMVTDFGLGKRVAPGSTALTQTDVWFGTEAYMAPEQRQEARTVTARADVYSLGKMLAELLTGEKPKAFVFDPNTVPSAFRYLCSRCCAPDAKDRFANAAELLDALHLQRSASQVVDPPIDGAERLIQRWMTDGPSNDAFEQIVQHFRRYPDEEELFVRRFPRLPKDLVLDLVTRHPSDALDLLQTYDGHIAGSLGFDYCDLVADFYVMVLDATVDINVMRLVLKRLWLLGPSHNRWYVGEKLASIMHRPDVDTSVIMLLVEVLREHPEQASWHDGYLRDGVLAEPVEQALSLATAR